MKSTKYLFIILLTICSLKQCFSQNDKKCVLHIIDTSYHNNDDAFVVKHKILISENRSYTEVLSILNYSEDFYFVCSYIDSIENNYFVFCNYGSSAGISKLFYIAPNLKSIFESPSLFEFEIPLYTSFTKDSSAIRIISFKDGNCGILINKKVEILMSSEKIKTCNSLSKKFVKKRELPFE
jgi:hypothetical protein